MSNINPETPTPSENPDVGEPETPGHEDLGDRPDSPTDPQLTTEDPLPPA